MKWKLNNVEYGIIMLLLCTTLFSAYAQPLDYGLIRNNQLYIGYNQNEAEYTETFRSINLSSGAETTTELTLIGKSNRPFYWNIHSDYIFLIWYGTRRIRNRLSYVIKTWKINSLDSTVYLQNRQRKIDSLSEIYGSESKAWAKLALDRDKIENTRSIEPINRMLLESRNLVSISNHCNRVGYDFLALDEKELHFYIKNCKELTVWKFSYPPNNRVKSAYSDWEEIKTYSIDTIPFITSKGEPSHVLPSGTKHVYQSIKDTAFFEGRFKIVQQSESIYCINVTHGNIYYLGEDKIEKVGEVSLNNYPKWLLNKTLFIEDRDNQRLIFFANVEQSNTQLPFPNILVLKNRKTLNDLYPGLIGK